MKNFDFALRVLGKVRVPLHYHVYGPIDDRAYWAQCEQLAKDLPNHVQMTHEGIIDHAEVQAMVAQHDLFFLPTRGENFGHVILEALLAGTPPLIADTTPWKNLDAEGAGYVRRPG